MPWVFGWPLDSEYAIRIGKECNLVKYPNPRESDYFIAAVNQIAFEARWEHVRSCWVKGQSQLVFGVYVDERFRKHPPKRVAMSRMVPLERWFELAEFMPIEAKPEWYRAEDCTYTPWKGERWSGTYQGEDDDLVDYVSADKDADEAEDEGEDKDKDEDEDEDKDEDEHEDEDEYEYEDDDPCAEEGIVLPKGEHAVDEHISSGHPESHDEAEHGRDVNIGSIPAHPISEQGSIANTLAPQFAPTKRPLSSSRPWVFITAS
ncbi:hypothetical protein DAEQUDRAFT_728872 [Daedalea quercina L-15889]|uniref:Uncharacterized protein n=1 Tax=Daedalea quercina L-15889 TaxID=1314783 RepID=A0A165P1A9_9APHY|nr:hypothetical protein DAEQUDRAFT_728872 [Daedalea quercina L-15889]